MTILPIPSLDRYVDTFLIGLKYNPAVLSVLKKHEQKVELAHEVWILKD